MGTKVEGKSCLPEYFIMGDLNVSSNSSWPRFYDDKTQNGHLFDDFVLRPTHGYLAYNKKILKQTMLEQEAIFRKQVYELHRLYRIQKALMEQFHNKETYGNSMLGFASQSFSLSSHVVSEGMMVVNLCRVPTLGHDGNKSPNFLKEGSTRSSPSVVPLQDSHPKFSKKMLDHQLPADLYFDNEDIVGIKNTVDSSSKPFDPLARIHSTDLQNNVELTLGASEDTKYKENHLGERVADLNKPLADLCNEGILSAAACIDFVGVKNYTMQNQWPHLSTRSDQNFLVLSSEPLKDRDAHEGTGSYLFGANEDEMGWKNSFCHKESGKDTSNVNFFPPRCYDHGSFENCGRNRFISSSHAWQAVLPMASPLPGHHLESSCTATRLISPWLEIRSGAYRIPAAVQAPPLCNASAPNLQEKTSDLIAGNTSTYDQKREDCDINVLDDGAINKTVHKCEESSAGISWFKKGGFNASVDLNKESEDMQDFASAFPVADDIHKSTTCSSAPPKECSLAESERFLGSDRQMQTGGELALPIRNFIDLNDETPCTDNPKSLEVSSGQSGISLSKPIPGIDLEAPVFHNEGAAVMPQESVLSAESDGLGERECSPDPSVIAAAENIVALSMDRSGEVLLWFAEVVTSNEDDCGITRAGENRGDGEIDVFESMTLKLEETKVEDKWCGPKVSGHKSGEDVSAPLLLLTRPRRGQARRRRPRRDFQKDILPGLASLSRNEVTKDLQTLGGLMMKASGTAWRSASTSQAGRNGTQAKARKQRRSLAVAVAELRTSPDADGRSMIGWGRTTRRCRRQRCPSGNASVHLT